MNASRVTLKDVAAACGFTVNTVSRALRGDPRLSKDTRERISQVAREMGYMRNQLASSLRSGRTHVLAVILGGMSNPFYGIMADSIQDAAQSAGYSVMIMCSRDNAEVECTLVETAISHQVDGILLIPTSKSGPTIERLRQSDIPFVLMSRCLAESEADSVVCDEAEGAYLATKHLIEAGRRKLAFISSTYVVYSSEQRQIGFLRACDEAGIPDADRIVYESLHSITAARQLETWYEEMVNKLVQLRDAGFDGLFVFCDVEAWHVLDAMLKSGRFGADDFGIVSFDNIEGALSFPIPLCSVSYDFGRMAASGVELLRHRIHHNDLPCQTVVVPVSLVCRGSCHKKQ